MPRKIWITLVILLGFGTLLVVYINQVFLPVHLKGLITVKAREALHRDIRFDQIHYNPLHGFVITRLTIFRRDDAQLPLLQVPEARFHILLTDILRRRQVVIPSLTLIRPFTHLIRGTDQQWNISDLLRQDRPAAKEDKSFRVLLGGIAVVDGKIEFTDLGTAPATREVFTQTNLAVRLSVNKGIRFELATRLTEQPAQVKAKGAYAPAGHALAAQVQTRDLDLSRWLRLFLPRIADRLPVALIRQADLQIRYAPQGLSLAGQLTAQAHAQWDGFNIQGTVNGTGMSLRKEGDRYHMLAPDLALRDGHFLWGDGREVSGTLRAEQAAASWDGQAIQVTGACRLEDGQLQLTDNHRLRADLQTPQLQLRAGPRRLEIHGDFSAAGLHWQRAGLDLTGALVLTDLSYLHADQETQITARTALTAATLHQAPGLTMQGDIAETPLTITGRDQTWAIRTSGLRLTNADIRRGPDQGLQGILQFDPLSIKLTDLATTIATTVTSEDLTLRINDQQTLTGSPGLDIGLRYQADQDPAWDYLGTITLNGARLTGLPRIGTAEQIQGTIQMDPQGLSTPDLAFSALQTHLRLNGTYGPWRAPRAKITAQTKDIDLEQLWPFLGPVMDRFQIIPRGRAALTFSYNGPVSDPAAARMTATAQLRDAQLTGKKIPAPVTAINGTLAYQPDQLRWQGLSGSYQGTTYITEGELNDFQAPAISARVATDRFQLDGDVTVRGQVLDIQRLHGTRKDSSLTLNGRARLKDHGWPSLDVNGRGQLQLADLPNLFPSITDKIAAFSPLQGQVNLDLSFTGEPNQWTAAQIKLAAQSPAITVKADAYTDFIADYQQGPDRPARLQARANLYDGRLDLTAETDIHADGLPANLVTTIAGLDLARMAQARRWKKQDVSGDLSGELNIAGPLLTTREWQGQGQLRVRDGRLWTYNLLQGLGRLLFIPEFEAIVFTEGHASFSIADGRLTTEDLLLTSRPIDLTGSGWIAFDRTVGLTIVPTIHEIQILRSQSLKKVPTAFLGQSGAVNIRITGSLDKPHYKVVTLPGKVLEKTTGVLFEGMKGIVEDLLQ